MKYTIQFDDKEEALKALMAQDAWNALWEISQYIRSHTKHEVPIEQTLECIKEELKYIMKYLD
jgi:hypothetical protein